MFARHVYETNTTVSIENIDAMKCYGSWKKPTLIIVDGPYGISGFPGDLKEPSGLPEWYAPHVAAWSTYSTPETTLWFWGTEIGWATVHPVLDVCGWDYQEAHIWNKGISHIAGNVNSKTIRSTPVVTEMCVRYTKRALVPMEDGTYLNLKDWLREEWVRSGLPLSRTNEACGVKNAATRKYFTRDSLWYFPPPQAMEQLSQYANEFGNPKGRPYFSVDGVKAVTADEWEHMRAKWNHIHGETNVWNVPPLHGKERLKTVSGKAVHYNQKPEKIIKYIIQSSTDAGDVVWDPFSGLATVPVCCLETGRTCFAAEISKDVYDRATDRLSMSFEEFMSKRRTG